MFVVDCADKFDIYWFNHFLHPEPLKAIVRTIVFKRTIEPSSLALSGSGWKVFTRISN